MRKTASGIWKSGILVNVGNGRGPIWDHELALGGQNGCLQAPHIFFSRTDGDGKAE